MAKKKKPAETDFPTDLEEVAKIIIHLVQQEQDEMEQIFQVHNVLKRVYKKGRSRGERDAMAG